MNKPTNDKFQRRQDDSEFDDNTDVYMGRIGKNKKGISDFWKFPNKDRKSKLSVVSNMNKINNFNKTSNNIETINNLSEEEEKEFEQIEDEQKIIENYNMKHLDELRHKILTEEKPVVNVEKGRVKIKMDEKNQLFYVNLPVNKFTIGVEKDEYRVYASNSKSYIIADQPNLRVAYKKLYVYIEKHQDTYFVVTNQNIQFSEKTNGLTKEKDVISFYSTNLAEIKLENEILKLKYNEVYENALLKDNRTLLISEEKGKVYLPYLEEDLREAMETYSDLSVSEIIEKKYVNPIKIYKNSMVSRFREAYNLMYNKENRSFKDSILLGIELMFEFNLHPAIISACRNLQELDIYLDCLDDNELDKFSCFKIIYKAMPAITKNRMQIN